MTKLRLMFAAFSLLPCLMAQTSGSSGFKLVLPDHKGRLTWAAEGFKVTQMSAKPAGEELGIRAKDETAGQELLSFLFIVRGASSLTSAACRDGALEPEKKNKLSLKITSSTELASAGHAPLSLVSYTTSVNSKTWYYARGFVAAGEVCGDLEVYSLKPLSLDDSSLKKMFASLTLDQAYNPASSDIFVYGQTLFQQGLFKAAAPVFEKSLNALTNDPKPWPSIMSARRVITDQAGMSYGMAGEIDKARALFEKAIGTDPDYPMYYHNLACADAEEKKLDKAKEHLRAAFARKANVIPGEAMPDPTKDDSFTPYQGNKEFWAFVQSVSSH